MDFFSKYGLETADLVTFTEEILNGKLHFLCIDPISLEEIHLRETVTKSFCCPSSQQVSHIFVSHIFDIYPKGKYLFNVTNENTQITALNFLSINISELHQLSSLWCQNSVCKSSVLFEQVFHELLLRNGWPTKGVKPYSQPGPFSDVLTIANLRSIQLGKYQNYFIKELSPN